MQVVDAAWEQWLSSNIARGCTPVSLIDAMVQAGFDADEARVAVHEAFGQRRSNPPRVASVTIPAARADHHDHDEPSYQHDDTPIARANLIRAHDRDVRVLLRCERPQLVVFADLLSADECGELIERSRHRLQRSTTVNPVTGSEDVIRSRTSEGVWYRRGEDALIERLEARIASLTNWPVENGEGLQVLHYGRSGEYSPHFDYFAPDQPGSAMHTAQGGQRVATLVIYLNDVIDGGATIFPAVGLSVAACAGGAVFFRYLNLRRELDPLTLHGGAPVLAGDKWILTKWLRERAYG
ncbi:proline dioxygenase [Burkholderia sp. SRS-W-2-2016]|uniref:2OG-Fe(II) oxygenase n=1 Tax=Burkholderia sp. SRS-W-2-2016 TaxID=1926878 RepID=UPI00094AD947|nr:2OG-Fe(II) oxygenase [Burkholderia sp. SRS-W-2-2016]OLL28524.1 proline dioxygenase [Burkholderia sp. SRS-W-2-2016]